MASHYVVLRELSDGSYEVLNEVPEARSAEHACRLTAEVPALEASGELDKGVTLIAVPLRNWTSGRHTLKAETTRRIRST